MKIYRFISTIKAKDATGKKPTHFIVAKTEQNEEKGEFVASLWAREYKNEKGEMVKFLSGEMKSQWTDRTDTSKSRDGFVIVKERDLNELLKIAGVEEPKETEVKEKEEF